MERIFLCCLAYNKRCPQSSIQKFDKRVKLYYFLIPFPVRYNENKPVTSSRDTQEIQPDVGAEMLRIFKEYTYESSILDEFNFYENRQGKFSNNNSNQRNQIKNTLNMGGLQNNNQNYPNGNNYPESLNYFEENSLNFKETNFKNQLQEPIYNFGNPNISNRTSILKKTNEKESNFAENFEIKLKNSKEQNHDDNLDNPSDNENNLSQRFNKNTNIRNQNNYFIDKSKRFDQIQNNSEKKILKRINSTDNILKQTDPKNSDEES